MGSPVSLWIVDGFVLFTLLVVAPSISIAIAYAAWKGKPRTFDRGKYFASFVACLAASAFLMIYAQRMHADVRTFHYAIEVALFELGALIFGVAGGCMLGTFTYRPGQGPPGQSRN
jgi:hypothetical protein